MKIEKLLELELDFKKDLPDNIFKTTNYCYWFFERPILDYRDMICKLFAENSKEFKRPVTMVFGNILSEQYDIFSFNEYRENYIYSEIEKSMIEYPIILTNLSLDWIIYESSFEEIGVFALNKKHYNDLCGFLNSNFISCSELKSMMKPESWYYQVAKCLFNNYCLK